MLTHITFIHTANFLLANKPILPTDQRSKKGMVLKRTQAGEKQGKEACRVEVCLSVGGSRMNRGKWANAHDQAD